MNCASTVMWTSLPTSQPPVSRAAFQFRPKSLRLILPLAEMPMRVLPQGSLFGAVGPSTSNVTGLVTPCTVRSPVTRYSASPLRSTFVDLNVIWGYFSASKKSALFRCPSRCASPVLIVEMSIEASTVDKVESARCSVRVPTRPEKDPFTLEIIMWRTLNSAEEWAGSSFQVVTEAGEKVVVVAIVWLLSQPWMRPQCIRCNNYSTGVPAHRASCHHQASPSNRAARRQAQVQPRAMRTGSSLVLPRPAAKEALPWPKATAPVEPLVWNPLKTGDRMAPRLGSQSAAPPVSTRASPGALRCRIWFTIYALPSANCANPSGWPCWLSSPWPWG